MPFKLIRVLMGILGAFILTFDIFFVFPDAKPVEVVFTGWVLDSMIWFYAASLLGIGSVFFYRGHQPHERLLLHTTLAFLCVAASSLGYFLNPIIDHKEMAGLRAVAFVLIQALLLFSPLTMLTLVIRSDWRLRLSKRGIEKIFG